MPRTTKNTSNSSVISTPHNSKVVKNSLHTIPLHRAEQVTQTDTAAPGHSFWGGSNADLPIIHIKKSDQVKNVPWICKLYNVPLNELI